MKLDYIVISHIGSAYAPTGPFINYLKTNGAKFLALLHPFSDIYLEPTSVEYYDGTNLLVRKNYLRFIKKLNNQFISYLFEFVLNILYIVNNQIKADKLVGMDCLGVIGGIILKKVGFVENVIYYNVDYSRERFENRMVNYLYISLDNFSAKQSDQVWNVSKRTCEERIKNGVDEKNVIYMPNGVHLSKIKNSTTNTRDRYSLVYVGHVQKEKGLQDIIRSFPEILAKEKKARLVIIGIGEYLNDLKKLVQNLSLNDNVLFLGKKTNDEVLSILTKHGIGLALYTNDRDYVYYSDPVKVKEYLACGCPTIISYIPEVAHDLEDNDIGVVIHNTEDILKAYLYLLDESIYDSYSKRAIKFASNYDWYCLYDAELYVN